MAKLRQIKRRIKTTQSIAKITRAMEMVAALKMKRAQDQALSARPYAQKVTQVLANLTTGAKVATHPLFLSSSAAKGKKEKNIILLVSPNRGLCGSLVTSLLRELFSFMDKQTDKELAYVNYGKKGRDFLKHQNLPILADFEASEPPAYEKAVDLARVLQEGFLGSQFQRVYLAYTHFESTMSQSPVVSPLLPLEREPAEEQPKTKLNFEYLFEPSSQTLLDAFLPHIVEIKIYQAILEAFASEQSARMMAMQAATENAQEIMAELTLIYNTERQQLITNEIADIVTAQLGLEAA